MMQRTNNEATAQRPMGSANKAGQDIYQTATLLRDLMADMPPGQWRPSDVTVQREQRIAAVIEKYFARLGGTELATQADALLQILGLSCTAETLSSMDRKAVAGEAWCPVLSPLAQRLQSATAINSAGVNPPSAVVSHALDGFRDTFQRTERVLTGAPPGPSRGLGWTVPRPSLAPLIEADLLELIDSGPSQPVSKAPPVSADSEPATAPDALEGDVLKTRDGPPMWRRKNRLPDAARQFLQARVCATQGHPTTRPTSAQMPHYLDTHGAVRPMPACAARYEEALEWLAGAVEKGSAGGVIEAEAFAYMYNLPARLWRPQTVT
ncbi:MAG: hypothetical protein EOO40_04780 [Deltaproteobacteria bacterium]|nr:MAG: hypothetical protein EOO40_04780 [Deltaproteobacteria bacterium]